VKGRIPSLGHASYELIRNLRKAQPRAKDYSPGNQQENRNVSLLYLKRGNGKQY